MIYLIVFLGLVLRAVSLNQSFWLDEATSANVAKNFSFADIVTKFSPGDFHPPLYYLTLKAWSIPFGVSEISTRLMSILCALFTIYLTYLLAKQVFEKSTSVIASLLLATAPLHVYYSQEARMYSLQTFLVTLSAYAFVKLITKVNPGWWLTYFLSLILIGATDYLPLLIVLVFWMYAVAKKKSLLWWSGFVFAHSGVALFLAIWAPTFVKQFSAGIEVEVANPAWWATLGKSGIKELALLPVKFMLGRISFASKVSYGLAVGIVGLIFSPLLFKSLMNYKKTLFFWLWLLVPVVLAFLLGFKLSVFSYFRLIFVLPAFYILLAYGLSKVRESIFPFAFMAVVLINTAFSWTYLSNEKFHREDWRGMIQIINEECKEKSCAVIFPADSQQEAYRYYAGDKNLVQSQDLEADKDIIWLVRYVQNISDPNDLARKNVEQQGYYMTEEKNFNGVIVWKYGKIIK